MGLGLTTPHVLKFAQSFFNCEGLTYVPLENDGDRGSSGSHFERAVFFNEIMTASIMKDQVFSGFSLNLLKDSGWYGVNEAYADEMLVGRKMGCEWFKNCHDVRNAPYFCYKPGEESCNFDYTAAGSCTNSFLERDGCYMIEYFQNFDCAVDDQSEATALLIKYNFHSRGPMARCFKSNVVSRQL